MPATMTTVDAILKEVYALRIEDSLQSETTALKRIERTSEGVVETVGGKYVNFPIRVGRNTGIGNRGELEQLPNPGEQKYAEVTVPLKYMYGRVRMTGQVMQLAEKDYQAFASAMDNEMEYLKDDLAKDQNRQVYGDTTGLIASITDTAISATHTVDNAQWLEIGMNTDILIKSSGATVILANVITDIVGNTVTWTSSFTGATTQGVYRQGNYNKEVSGMGSILSSTSVLHGLNPTTQRKWAAIVTANGGVNRALSEGLMIETADKVRINGGKTSLILTSLGVRRAYFNLLTQQRRYTDTKEFAGGFTGLAFNYGTEVPVVEDVDAPPNSMRFLDESKIKVFRNKEWHWADEDGSVLKWVRDFDAWEALMRLYWEIGTTQRNAHALLSDITEG